MLKYSKELLRKIRDENVLTPLYDNEDSVCGIDLGGFAYYFQKNLQGAVIAITNSYGNVVARYTYDAWGVCTVVSDETGIIARVNPYRYRGYYYDSEIGLYYLQSRYYDPQVGRFVNADSQFDSEADLIGYNIYAYCGNTPISNADYMGTGLLLAIGIGLLAGAVLGGVASYVKYKKVKISWIAGGAIIGALLVGGGYWVYTTVKGAAATWSAYKAAQIGVGASTGSATVGRMFEKFYYEFNGIALKFQQVVWGNFRFDAIFKNRIIELKNYDWAKYGSSQIRNIAKQFASQGQKYLQAIGKSIRGQKIKGITFYFSSKPPKVIIDALKALGIAVEWVK
ncbi:MAG: RHS repeat-associated core domain-containing protein [Ruminococcaceae bacterium]|nr:RHS repeat-associated core domain-containing protein [Oscillospiraceae bacterium]